MVFGFESAGHVPIGGLNSTKTTAILTVFTTIRTFVVVEPDILIT
jgi:hypothetical protein